MRLFKEYPFFIILALGCLLLFSVGAYVAIAEHKKILELEKQFRRALSEYSSLQSIKLAPTSENMAASTANVSQLQEALARIRGDLKKGAYMKTATDDINVIAGIQEFINEFREKAAENSRLNLNTGEMENHPIALSAGMYFGFERYMDEIPVPKEASVIALLDKQRQVLTYLVDRLIRSQPHQIHSIQRELVELSGEAKASNNGYKVPPAVTARLPGVIDTLAFRIQYTGYTDSLRQFLNALATFEMPIVVRSIEVARLGDFDKENEIWSDDLFGKENKDPSKEPVIENNLSTFTLILEFIELRLSPEEEAEARQI